MQGLEGGAESVRVQEVGRPGGRRGDRAWRRWLGLAGVVMLDLARAVVGHCQAVDGGHEVVADACLLLGQNDWWDLASYRTFALLANATDLRIACAGTTMKRNVNFKVER